MTTRKIVVIDEDKCNGCGLCIPNCPEGALQIIDKKARLVSDLFCDGLGACIGHCPEDAITVEEREAEPYDERKVMENIVKHGENTIKAHLKHLKDHGETKFLKQATDFLEEKGIENPLKEEPEQKKNIACGCPGTMIREMKKEKAINSPELEEQESELQQWPIQINLVPPNAPFFNDADLLIAADCVGFANPNVHSKLMKGKAIVIGCPKLDDTDAYKEKIKSIIEMNDLKSITVAIMEVPCCYGMYQLVEEALKDSGKDVKLNKVIIGIDGNQKGGE